MSNAGVTINPYDEVVFPSQPLPQSHPDRLAAIAWLFGLDAPPADHCRVLELGCATGGNIIPLADRLPNSQFVGVDYSQAQIQMAERNATALASKNLELHQADIAKLGTSLGKFDYIICHGVFSWVPPALQAKILELVRDSLTPNGVAYISYNTHPGWYLKGTIRDVLAAIAPEGAPATARLARGKQLLQFLAQAGERQGTPYGRLLKQEIEGLEKFPDGYIFHEYFESENAPLYFYQFMALAGQYDLQFLGESNIAALFSTSYGPMAEMQLQSLKLDLISTEQHFDVLRNRSFRQTLLCRADAPLSRQVTTAPLTRLYLNGQVSPQNPAIDPRSNAAEIFQTKSGITLSTESPALKAALTFLDRCWPRTVPFAEVAAEVGRQLATPQSGPQLSPEYREALAQSMIQCIASGLLDITSLPDGFTTRISERPMASPIARNEAQQYTKATNRRHQLVNLDEAIRTVLWYLDGNRDRPALLRELAEAVDRGDMSLMIGGLPARRGDAILPILESTLDDALAKLAANAFLIK